MSKETIPNSGTGAVVRAIRRTMYHLAQDCTEGPSNHVIGRGIGRGSFRSISLRSVRGEVL